jgi:flagellar protein FlaG
MGMKIPGIANPGISPDYTAPKKPVPSTESRLGRARSPAPVPQKQDIKKSLDILRETFRLFNRRLDFSVNEKIDRVVVKVIDGTTDKVIKEIPPEEIQKLIARIKETIGILLDQEI